MRDHILDIMLTIGLTLATLAIPAALASPLVLLFWG